MRGLAQRELHVLTAFSAENNAPCWNSTPLRLPFSASSMTPPRFGSKPMIVRISTDLPPPDAPTRPRISP
jgi:hypothetical protein